MRMTRKATRFSEAVEVITSVWKRDLEGLPTFSDVGVYGHKVTEDDSPAALDFHDAFLPPQKFILETGFASFVVDTEGYGYARYIARIKTLTD